MKLSAYINGLQNLLDKRGDKEILETSEIILLEWEIENPGNLKKIDPCRKFR